MALPTPRKLIAVYFVTQALAVTGWWCLLLLVPESVGLFQPAAWPAAVLMSFGIPDFLMVIVGSSLAAYASWFAKDWAGVLVWMLAGGLGYATLYCLGASVATSEAWLATSMMVVISGLTLVSATMFGTGKEPKFFREMDRRRSTAMSWTAFQILIFWSVFLWIFPMGICELTDKLNLPGLLRSWPSAGWSLFGVASLIGISSAWVMSGGGGTPLPTATTSKLVVHGPYRFVRNPMALAGILQGLGVGIIMGNIWVLIYAMLGAVVWHLVARPPEEEFLRDTFGASYIAYRQRVGLWLPFLFRGL